MSNVPDDWSPELEERVYSLQLSDEDHKALLRKHRQQSFLTFADDRGALKGSVNVNPHGDTSIAFSFLVEDDKPENHSALLSALADFIKSQQTQS